MLTIASSEAYLEQVMKLFSEIVQNVHFGRQFSDFVNYASEKTHKPTALCQDWLAVYWNAPYVAYFQRNCIHFK